MLLKNRCPSQFIKPRQLAVLWGFIASVACVAGLAQDAATKAVPAAGAPARLVIVNAVYGNLSDPTATTNVTKIVAAMVSDDTLDFRPSNEAFGGDPAPGMAKQFKVDYTIDGVADTKSGLEHRRLRLSANPPPPPKKSRLVIVRAIYGDLSNGQVIDVTADLTDLIENDGLKMAVNGLTFGDPAFGKTKELRVVYTFDGRKKTVAVQENDTLTISRSVEVREHYKRMLFVFLWIIAGVVVVSALATTVALLARKWKK